MKEREYTEGPEARAKFEQFARAVLQAPKPKMKAKKQPQTATSRKSKSSDKD